MKRPGFHLWCHCQIISLVEDRWQELGGKVVKVNPRYTSKFAYNGSGVVKRSQINYTQATFRNGQRYNANLSASYNIGARYWYAVIMGDTKFIRVGPAEASSQTRSYPGYVG